MRWIFINLPNPSSRTTDLWSTQRLTEMSTRILPGGQRAAGRRARLTILPPSLNRLSSKCGCLDVAQPNGPSRPLAGIVYLFYTFFCFLLDVYIDFTPHPIHHYLTESRLCMVLIEAPKNAESLFTYLAL
jgi:hypothetical protein